MLTAGSPTAGPFLAGDLGQERDLVWLNVTSTVEMAHRFGNRLRERGRGGLILLSSAAGSGAFPYQANCAASKAYIASFGLALHEELASAGVKVLVLPLAPPRPKGSSEPKESTSPSCRYRRRPRNWLCAQLQRGWAKGDRHSGRTEPHLRCARKICTPADDQRAVVRQTPRQGADGASVTVIDRTTLSSPSRCGVREDSAKRKRSPVILAPPSP